MSRECIITGTKPQFGNNVSHSNRKTRRVFLPNMKKMDIWSEALKRKVKLYVSAHGIRTMEHNGGFDNFLISTPVSKLTPDAQKLKKQVERAIEKKATAA